MEVNSDGNLVISTTSLVPSAAPTSDAPAPAAVGGDLDDSGDDSDDEDEDDDDHSNNDGQDNNNDGDGNQDDGPHSLTPTCEFHSKDEPGYFPTLLRKVLQKLGSTMKPLCIT